MLDARALTLEAHPASLQHRPNPRRVLLLSFHRRVLGTDDDDVVLNDLVVHVRRLGQVAAALLDLLGTLHKQGAEVDVRVGVPRIRRDRRQLQSVV